MSEMLLLSRLKRGENGGLEGLNHFHGWRQCHTVGVNVTWLASMSHGGLATGRCRVKALSSPFPDLETLIIMPLPGFGHYRHGGDIYFYFYFLKFIFILFIFACVGSSLLRVGFL